MCPNCLYGERKKYPGIRGVFICENCDAIFGNCLKESAGDILEWAYESDDPNPDPEKWIYFDLELVSCKVGSYQWKTNRIHGWFHKDTKRILQTG